MSRYCLLLPLFLLLSLLLLASPVECRRTTPAAKLAQAVLKTIDSHPVESTPPDTNDAPAESGSSATNSRVTDTPPSRTRASPPTESSSEAEAKEERRHVSANPTLHNSGSGALAFILTGVGLLVCIACGYVAYLRLCLGIKVSELRREELTDTLRSNLPFRLGSENEYQPVESAYRPPPMPVHQYPVAYPPQGSIDLVDIGRSDHPARQQRSSQISQHTPTSSLMQSQRNLTAQQQQPKYSVDADDIEYYSDEEQ